ncbi:hypothetical protein C8Q80DRAFT_1274489 [Daedaleopsis nitida]|nr:hypothetical protein C8Q80DRAFT_1274489 [Daedaleopsis nitida]
MASASPASFARPPRPQQQQNDLENRGSMLRASILESALELGVGSSRTVAHWMFNPVGEVMEEEEEGKEQEGVVSPSLTYASTATSEESNLSAGLAQRSQPGAGIFFNSKEKQLTLDTTVQYSPLVGLSPAGATPDRTLQFDLRVTPEPRAISPSPSPQTKNKLRKTRPDGYESDGGYMSESGKVKKEKKEKREKEKKEKKSKKKAKDADKDGVAVGGATDYETDGGYLSETALSKKKSKKEKKDKSKAKNADSPATDYETDKGSSSMFSRSKSRKQSVTSPVSGDESDGGYLSEASKKKRFFRLNSKSRKKQDSVDSSQDQPPPVPALPSMASLNAPIYEKFSRSTTPIPPDSRNATPIPGIRPSIDTFMTVDTTTSMDTSLTSDTSTLESDEKRDSMLSTDGLTRAFRDAESVRSPSIDFLSTFRRPNGENSPVSPSKYGSFGLGDRPNSPLSPKSPVAALSAAKSVRSRPKISAPNTSALNINSKHVPVPLTLTPPTPTHASHPGQPSPDTDYVLVTPNPSTPMASDRQQSSFPPDAAPPSPSMQRPKVLAYYDLPPPSPPPRGPLPDVPSDISRSTSPSWSMMDSSRFPRSGSADSNSDARGLQHRPLASPVDRPNTASHPLSREISRDVSPSAHSAPAIQRGRVSPFPTAPVFPREQTASLVRQTSRVTQEAVTRAARKNATAPASVSPYTNGHSRWMSNEQTAVPASAQPYLAGDSHWPTRDQLGVEWQPRSASALDTRRPYDTVDGDADDDGRSWLEYDDDLSDRSLSVPNTRPGSTEPPEPSPDVNAILAGFRAERDAHLATRTPRKASARDTLAGIVADYERDTVYLDADEGGGDRSSVWSEANSRYSFLDDEKSADIRAKFVRRVEAMYGKELIPPVPTLDPSLRG